MKHVTDGIELPPFPWAWHQQGDANDHVLLTSGGQWVIAFRTNGEFMPKKEEAVIRHLVASANACAGIPIKDLDRVKDATAPVFEMLMETRKQRDQLMASLIGMCGAMQKAMPHLPADHEAIYCGEWFEAAQETIAAARASVEKTPGADSWIDWSGGDQPVSDDTVVMVRLADGKCVSACASDCSWRAGTLIVAYRVVKGGAA